MPSELNFIGDTRPLTVDEDPAEVGTRFSSGGRLGSTKTVVELHTGGRAVYVNPACVTFFAEGEVRRPPPAPPPPEGPGFGLP